jgi:hypothetical protein
MPSLPERSWNHTYPALLTLCPVLGVQIFQTHSVQVVILSLAELEIGEGWPLNLINNPAGIRG